MNKKTNLLAELSDIKRLCGIIKESLDNNVITVWENNNRQNGTYGSYEFYTVTMEEQTRGEFTKYQPGDTLISHRNVLVRVIPVALNESKINELGFTQDGNPMGFDNADTEDDIKKFDQEHGNAPTDESKEYADIVFLQGHEAEEVMDILNQQGAEAAMNHLKQWDNGEYHNVTENPFGTQDKLYREGDYVMGYNTGIPYIGLSKLMTSDDGNLGEEENGDKMQQVATAMSLAGTLAQENSFTNSHDKKGVTSTPTRIVTNNGQIKPKEKKAAMPIKSFHKLSEVFTNLS